jgi:REP element-mobilizing transposase RayT
MRNFIATKKPHVICVGGESREALMVAADLREIIGQLVEDEQFPLISVEICDNELAKIYSNSIKGEVSNSVIVFLLQSSTVIVIMQLHEAKLAHSNSVGQEMALFDHDEM